MINKVLENDKLSDSLNVPKKNIFHILIPNSLCVRLRPFSPIFDLVALPHHYNKLMSNLF